MSIRNHSHATKFSAASRLLLVGASLLCTSNAAAAGSGEAGSANTAGATSVHEFIGLPIVYAAHSGTEFDGRHAFSFDASRVAHLPKLSGGFGVRPTAGVLIENLLSNFGASAAIGFEYTNHQAISYNVDDSWYAHEMPDFTICYSSFEVSSSWPTSSPSLESHRATFGSVYRKESP